MKYKSDLQCTASVKQLNGDVTRCAKGAEYYYGDDACLCRSHFSQYVTDDYITNNPECVRRVHVQIGNVSHQVSREQLEAIKKILST